MIKYLRVDNNGNILQVSDSDGDYQIDTELAHHQIVSMCKIENGVVVLRKEPISVFHEYINGDFVLNRSKQIQAQIIEAEARLSQRRIREAMLSGDYTFISQIDAEIAELREKLRGL